VGGGYRIVMRDPDGTLHDVAGVYREIVPGRRLAFTWAWRGTPEAETLVEIDLRARNGGTELTLSHTKFAAEGVRDMHEKGWVGCVGRLERLFAA
jgi:uncharacterized protein YndB with AHSA1/START domain